MYFFVLKPEKVVSLCKFDVLVELFVRTQTTAKEFNDILVGYPDYLLASKSEQGKIILGTPFLAIVEAKRDDFTVGWGQCAAEMYAIQQLNQQNDLEVLGIVSNGDYWQFAFLKNNIFRKCKNNYTIEDLDAIYNFMVSHLHNVLIK